MFAKVGIIQQSAKHNLKKNNEERQKHNEAPAEMGVQALEGETKIYPLC